MSEYRQQFELLSAPLDGVSDDVLEGNFVNRLKAETKAELCLLNPKGLEQIMELAQRIEEKMALMRGANGPRLQRHSTV